MVNLVPSHGGLSCGQPAAAESTFVNGPVTPTVTVSSTPGWFIFPSTATRTHSLFPRLSPSWPPSPIGNPARGIGTPPLPADCGDSGPVPSVCGLFPAPSVCGLVPVPPVWGLAVSPEVDELEVVVLVVGFAPQPTSSRTTAHAKALEDKIRSRPIVTPLDETDFHPHPTPIPRRRQPLRLCDALKLLVR